MSIKKMEEMTWKEFNKLDKEITVTNKMVIINHHLDLGHIKAIENAREYLLTKFNIKLLETASRIIYSKQNHEDDISNEEDCQKEIHADVRETSFMLYKHSKLVRECYKNLEPVYLDMKKFIMSGGKCFRENGIVEGYVGSPGNASFEYGQKQFKNMITQTGTLILRFLEDGYIPEISSGIKSAMNQMKWR